MKRILAIMTALGCGSTAQALSCMPPDAASIYNFAQDAEDAYYAALGQLEFTPPPHSDPPEPQAFTATFNGYSLAADGFTNPLSRAITLQTECIGPWCGMIASDVPHLVVLRVAGNNLILTLGACPFATLHDPSAAQIATFVSCAQGKTCQPSH